MKRCQFDDCLHYCPESLSKCDEFGDIEGCKTRKCWERQQLEMQNTEFDYGHDVNNKIRQKYEGEESDIQ